MRIISSDHANPPLFSMRWLTPAGTKHYSGIEFVADVNEEKKLIAAIGIRAGDKVGIRGDNSYAWMVSDVALAELDVVSVVFPTEFQEEPLTVLSSQYGLCFCLVSESDPEAQSTNLNTAVMRQIDKNRHRARVVTNDSYPALPDDHSFVFSSGTSGSFKGMVISKKGILDQIRTFGSAMDLGPKDRTLLFMPFSSMQNRVLYYGAMMFGMGIDVAAPHRLLEGLKKFQPTLLVAPPIFYEAIEKSIIGTLKNRSFSVRIFSTVISKLTNNSSSLGASKAMRRLLRVIFKDAHSTFGGRMRVMITGMAKIGPSTLSFYKSLGLPLVQVYGLTECGVVCVNTLAANKIGTVGKPLSGNTVSVAEDGEIFVRKDNPQTSRFFHFEASTEDTRFENGGVYTGDLGLLSKDGTLTLIGRKKSTIVGHTGVKVQPEPIEKRLEEHAWISSAVLVGLESGHKLGVVLRPTRDLSDSELHSIEDDVREVVDRMAASFKNHIRMAYSTEDFTAENGLLTRNLKISRNAVRERFFSGTF